MRISANFAKIWSTFKSYPAIQENFSSMNDSGNNSFFFFGMYIFS